MLIPSADVGIIVLTNASPIGVPETVVAQFTDLVQFGRVQRDWTAFLENAFAPFLAPTGSLVGKPRPTNPAPPRANAAYAGTSQNAYYGPLQVVDNHGTLELRLPGTISKASFAAGKVVLEYYDEEGLGTFVR
jgi:hypothetical protein